MELEFESEAEIEAKTLASELVEGRTTLRQAFSLDASEAKGADIDEQVARFRSFSSLSPMLPCVLPSAHTPIPLDASHINAHSVGSWLNHAEAFRRDVEHVTRLRTHMLPVDMVKDFFVERIARLLGIRGGGASTITVANFQDAGLEVRVTTQCRGGRVFYSPATLFTKDRLFGAPTSPVVRPILPGIYLFGVEDATGSRQWDAAEYEIPPFYDIGLPL